MTFRLFYLVTIMQSGANTFLQPKRIIVSCSYQDFIYRSPSYRIYFTILLGFVDVTDGLGACSAGLKNTVPADCCERKILFWQDVNSDSVRGKISQLAGNKPAEHSLGVQAMCSHTSVPVCIIACQNLKQHPKYCKPALVPTQILQAAPWQKKILDGLYGGYIGSAAVEGLESPLPTAASHRQIRPSIKPILL